MKTIKQLLLVVSLVVFSSNAFAGYWLARADSPDAWGEGTSASLPQAKFRALQECAMRTRFGYQCYITNWTWVY